MNNSPTLAVLAHRARAVTSLSRPIPMFVILEEAQVSVQWWHQFARGMIRHPAEERLDRLAAALGVSRAVFNRAHAETLRRFDAGDPV